MLLARYAASAGVMLAAKVLLQQVFSVYLSEVLAYAAVHVMIFFLSFFTHCFATFRVRPTLAKLSEFLSNVITFKILDYLVFVVLFKKFAIESIYAVVAASMVIFLLRFYKIAAVFKRPPSQDSSSPA